MNFTLVVTLLLTLVFITSFAYYSKYQFLERNSSSDVEKRTANEKWHTYGLAIRTCFIALLYFVIGWKITVILAVFVWIAFDLLINVVALNQHAFYVGKTAWIDKQFQKTKHPEFYNLISKLVLLAVAIIIVHLIK